LNKYFHTHYTPGRVDRVHGNHLNTSTLSLVFEHLTERAKSRIVRGHGKVNGSIIGSRVSDFLSVPDRDWIVMGVLPLGCLVDEDPGILL